MKDFLNNIKFSYLFRDEGNYKEFGYVIFEKPDDIAIEEADQMIRNKLIDGEYFYPLNWQIPQFDMHKAHDDGSWYEYEKVELTGEAADMGMTIREFMEKII